jgi:peptide chain release factor 1
MTAMTVTEAGSSGRSRCMIEIRAGTADGDTVLWSRDLYEMYEKLADRKGWTFEPLCVNSTALGGFEDAIVSVEGDACLRTLQYESGGHRVQRVPETEGKGRIHTSMAVVAVMLEPDESDFDVRPEDYRQDIFRALAGNVSVPAVRLTHYETNIVVMCHNEPTYRENLAKAIRILRTLLYDRRQPADTNRPTSSVVVGSRREKIRTYNYPANRLTDHRIGFSFHRLDQVLMGFLDPVSEALLAYDRRRN